MKLETILSAMDHTKIKLTHAFNGISDASVEDAKRYSRQHFAFRTRIIRMDAEKDDVIEGQFKAIVRQHETILQLRNEIGTWEEIDELMFEEKDHEPNADAG